MSNAKINLLPDTNAEKWKTYVPPVKKGVVFSRGGHGESLDIEINGDLYGVGKWVTELPVEAGKTYDFSVKAKTKSDVTDTYVIVTFSDDEGNMIIREHIKSCEREADYIRFFDKTEVPDGASKLKLELWLKGYEGKVKWYEPTLMEGTKSEERNVSVAVEYIPPHSRKRSAEGNMGEIFYSLEKCAEKNPDIILLGECMYDLGLELTLDKAAQTEDGEMCRRISEKAREYNSYIIYNFHEFDSGEYYNTSILFDRSGKKAGKYRKTHLTVTEYEEGMTPGLDYPVFETDFGKIGMLICFDHYFTETAERLAENGAEMIFISSAGDAAEKCIARAMDTGLYLAVCGWNIENSHGWGPGRIVAPSGELISDTDTIEEPAFGKIDLNKKIRRRWLSLGPADSEFFGVYRYEKNIHCKK